MFVLTHNYEEELYHMLHHLQWSLTISSVQFSHADIFDSLRTHGLQHARLPCPLPTPKAYSDSCPSSQWYHPTTSSSVISFSSHLQSFPASGSFLSESVLYIRWSIGVLTSASVLPMSIQDWFLLRLTSLISLLSKGFLRVFSSTKIQKHQFFMLVMAGWANKETEWVAHSKCKK